MRKIRSRKRKMSKEHKGSGQLTQETRVRFETDESKTMNGEPD